MAMYRNSFAPKKNVSDPNGVLNKIAEILGSMAENIEAIRQHLLPRGEADSMVFYQLINGEYRKVDDVFMKVDEFLDLAVGFEDKLGNPAKVDGLPAWALTDDSLGKLDVAADGMTATFTPAGLVGVLKVQVKADADLGAGVVEIIGELDVDISALQAVKVNLSGTVRSV